MNSLPEIGRLLRVSEQLQRRCELTLQQARARLKPVAAELADIAEQHRSLTQSMVSQRASNCTLSHAQLMTLLRHQAILRRQQQNLALDQARVEEQRSNIEREVQEYRQQRQVLLRKHTKFTGLQQRLTRQQMLASLRREEIEIEESTRPRYE